MSIEDVVPEVRALHWGWRIAIGLLAFVAVGFLGWWFLIRPAADHRAAVNAGIAAKVATSTVAASKDAAATAAQVVVLHDHSDTVTHENTTKILAASGASDAVPAAVGSAWLAALCARTVYLTNPACQNNVTVKQP